jgi:hypothetical protein
MDHEYLLGKEDQESVSAKWHSVTEIKYTGDVRTLRDRWGPSAFTGIHSTGLAKAPGRLLRRKTKPVKAIWLHSKFNPCSKSCLAWGLTDAWLAWGRLSGKGALSLAQSKPLFIYLPPSYGCVSLSVSLPPLCYTLLPSMQLSTLFCSWRDIVLLYRRASTLVGPLAMVPPYSAFMTVTCHCKLGGCCHLLSPWGAVTLRCQGHTKLEQDGAIPTLSLCSELPALLSSRSLGSTPKGFLHNPPRVLVHLIYCWKD